MKGFPLLRFADGIVILSEKKEGFKNMLQNMLHLLYEKLGLKINMDTT